MAQLVLPCCYLSPVSHYARLAHGGDCLLEVCDSYHKQTLRNRCLIASADGPLALTIPVEKPLPGQNRMRDIRISDHGRWRHVHWNALKTAYQNSPFFEYYADELAPFYETKWEFLADFNEDLMRLMCSWIDIDPQIQRTESYLGAEEPPILNKEYYQVFRQKLGVLPDLSIVDLVFNMGPESILYL
ncbi:MAG: WbqC family protein [Bacteroidaceae bacterium]|nr:WbqC family protein [Bacteroidaceae bacterium]